jgi:DNA-binding IclR family transcriptional regulator
MCDLRDETNLTVQLGIITTDGKGIIIESVASRNPIRFVEEKGVWTTDLNTGAGWKCLLAFLPKEESSRLMDALTFRRFTANTITSRKELEKALVDVRRHGYAVDMAEGREGLHCIAAPIFDRTGRAVGTICVSAPSEQLPERDFKRCAVSTVAAASAISAKLGWKNLNNQRKE